MHEDYSDPLDTVAEDGPADVFEESVTVRSEPFDSFDSFCGYSEEKQRLQETVVEPAGYDQYVTSSVLLVGDHIDCQTTTLAVGPEFTGECCTLFYPSHLGVADHSQLIVVHSLSSAAWKLSPQSGTSSGSIRRTA